MKLIDTIEEFKQNYNNDDIFISDNKLSENVLEYYINKYTDVKWGLISMRQTLTESTITKYNDKVHWFSISKYQTLSESFIEQYKDNVYWLYISRYQTLSEAFIIKYKDTVSWWYISQYQTLSESFIEQHKNSVDWVALVNNTNIKLSYEFILAHLYRFNLYEVWVGIEYNKEVINKLVEEFPYKFEIDKLVYEFK